MDHKCDLVAAEQLLLFAYGENDDPAVDNHVKTCVSCRAYLDSLDAVRDLVRKAGPESASRRSVARLTDAAGEIASGRAGPLRRAGGAASRSPWPAWAPDLAPALAAAALIVIVIGAAVWFRPGGHPPPTGGNEVPAYLAGASSRLIAFQAALDGETGAGTDDAGDDEEIDPGDEVWNWVAPADGGLDDLEDDLLDLGTSMTMLINHDRDGSGTSED
jgi:hypothetical protein